MNVPIERHMHSIAFHIMNRQEFDCRSPRRFDRFQDEQIPILTRSVKVLGRFFCNSGFISLQDIKASLKHLGNAARNLRYGSSPLVLRMILVA